MSSKNITSTYNLFKNDLSNNRLGKSLAHLRAMAAISCAPWDIIRDIDNIEESYGYLRQYALDGVEDPGRADMLSDLTAEALRVSAMIMRHVETVDSPRQYFSILRYEAMQPDSSIIELIHKYSRDYNKYVAATLIHDPSARYESDSLRKSIEALSVRLFNLIWTAFPFTKEVSKEIESLFSNESLSSGFKELILSALILGALEYYDESRLVLLAKMYLNGSSRIEIKALIGLMLGMWVHRESLKGRRFKDVMATVFEKKSWQDDLKMVFLELVRTRDTERISQKLQNEIIPQMMKMRPDILKKIDGSAADDEISSIDANPEWEELLEKSGLADRLKELSELQADGGDVMMNTFSHLKGFSFFNDVANWFLPFSPEHSSIANIVDDTSSDIIELILSSPMMCDGDKYSIVLSLERIPSANRRMMLSQFKLQDINLSELRSSELNPEKDDRKNICNKYIQDLYRFFNLYRRKSDFRNPFAKPINLASINILSEHIEDSDALTIVGEFYFKRGYWPEALEIFSVLEKRGDLSAQLLQKIGYCHQQNGDIQEAIKKYRRSELIRPDSLWTMRRLAQCYKLIGDNESALHFYQKIAEQKPDDLKVALNIGHCHLESGSYEEALKSYYKYEYLSDTPEKAFRPIAWCLFLTGDYERSDAYYEKIIAASPKSSDYMNRGHLYMALGRFREAIDSYQHSKQLETLGDAEFINRLELDRPYLEAAGVSPEMIDIVFDSVTD